MSGDDREVPIAEYWHVEAELFDASRDSFGSRLVSPWIVLPRLQFFQGYLWTFSMCILPTTGQKLLFIVAPFRSKPTWMTPVLLAWTKLYCLTSLHAL